MVGSQFLVSVTMSTGGVRAQLRVSFGLFGFGAITSQPVLWLPPILLLGRSTALLVSKIRYSVSPVQDDSHKSESA